MLGGVRLETILQTVKKTDALYQEKNYGNFLAFEPVTLVPFEPHLMAIDRLRQLVFVDSSVKTHLGGVVGGRDQFPDPHSGPL